MRHVWSVLCTKPIIERDTDKLSLIDIPEAAEIDSSLLALAQSKSARINLEMAVVSMFWAEKENEPALFVRLAVRSPGSRRQAGAEVVVDTKPKINESVRVVSIVHQVVFTGLGLYLFEVETRSEKAPRWRRVASVPLLVRSGAAS